ncbi:hypothetical protein pipiens_009630, partial [Culex pipiens pipiens]
QQALAGSCEARGYRDDVIEHLSEANHDFKVQSPPDPWQSENVEFTGLTEVPLSWIVNVNIDCLLVQYGSAVINRTLSIADAAKERAGRSTAAVLHNTLQTCWRFGVCIRSKLEYEPPPSSSATTPREVLCGVEFNSADAVQHIEAANVESRTAPGAPKDRWERWKCYSVRFIDCDTMTKIECIEEDGEKICADLPVDVASEEKIPHPEYDELSKLNKIALLRMARDDSKQTLSCLSAFRCRN